MTTTVTVDLAALHDALGSTTLAAFVAEGGDRVGADEALLEAAASAALAFPRGSAGASALQVLFDAIRDAAGTAVAGGSR